MWPHVATALPLESSRCVMPNNEIPRAAKAHEFTLCRAIGSSHNRTIASEQALHRAKVGTGLWPKKIKKAGIELSIHVGCCSCEDVAVA